MTRLFFLLALVTLACGVQAKLPMPSSDHAIPPTIEATPPKTGGTSDLQPTSEYWAAVCNASGLAVRSSPGEQYQRIGYLEQSTNVYVYLSDVTAGDGGSWAFVVWGEGEGWVNMRYICG